MPTRAESRNASRAKVLAAARMLFQERGFARTTVRDIASNAEVSVGTVMAVGDKRRLLVLVFDEAVAAVHAQRNDRRARATANSGAGTVDRILDLLAPFVGLFLQERELARDYAAILMSGNHGSAIFDGLALALVKEFADELQSSGMDPQSSARAAEVLHLSYLGALFMWAAGPNIGETAALESLRPAFTFILTPRET